MAETMNMMSVPVSKFTEIIKYDLMGKNYEPVIGIGKSGVGKTMSIFELTKELNIGFCELRLVTLLETDLLGIPDIIEKNGERVTTYAHNELLPRSIKSIGEDGEVHWVGIPKEDGGDGVEGVLVLDEITSATSPVRAAAYQLLDSKRALGNYHLPDGWKVVALGNGIDDGGVYSGMESAFLSRAICFRIEPNLKAWVKWAVSHGVNKTVVAYLRFSPKSIHVFDPDELASVFPCPRSWAALGKRLDLREKMEESGMLDEEDVELYASGTVGAEEAPKFAAFYAHSNSIISADSIMNGTATTQLNSYGSEEMLITIQGLVSALREEVRQNNLNSFTLGTDSGARFVNAMQWLVDIGNNGFSEYAATGMQDTLSSDVNMFSIVTSRQFDSMCPGFIKYVTAHKLVLKPIR